MVRADAREQLGVVIAAGLQHGLVESRIVRATVDGIRQSFETEPRVATQSNLRRVVEAQHSRIDVEMDQLLGKLEAPVGNGSRLEPGTDSQEHLRTLQRLLNRNAAERWPQQHPGSELVLFRNRAATVGRGDDRQSEILGEA